MDKLAENSELIDITDRIVAEEKTSHFSEEESLELYQTFTYLMEEFMNDNPTIISEPDFEDIFDENIKELMISHFDSDLFYTDDFEEELDEIFEHAKSDFYKYVIPPRSYPDTIILNQPDIKTIESQLNILRNKPQPTQRTPEWYEFRHNLITASNAYKAFENQTVKNQLIYEKCQPLNQCLYVEDANTSIKDVVLVNTNTPMHWGQKYEPLSIKIYEDKYKTKIEDFGCIQHSIYKFLGASPDGINIDKQSPRYGRMLEIKNIVNREINGIPKKEYWIQMQLQMEVCNLDECDFLETKFIEYPDYLSYYDDTTNEVYIDDNGDEFINVCISKDNKMKGAIIYFHTKEGTPFYVYRPLNLIHPYEISQWHEDTIDYYQTCPEFNYTFIKTIYWKLEQISCVLVCRNKHWFNYNIISLQEIWTTIEQERVSGYEHRAPNRRIKTDYNENVVETLTTGCLLNLNKENGKIMVIKLKEN
jgi:putative phage-type endonuclease